jgi:putative oxidoreductase
MERYLGKYSQLIYAALRIVVGFLFACHGAQKLFGVLGGHAELSDPEGLAAGIIEFVGGSMVAIGLLSSYAAFIASGEMAVAYFKAHAPRGFWPIMNFGELAALFCFVFLYISSRGSGPFSIDALLARRRNPG